MYYIGLDVGGTSIKALVINQSNEVLVTKQVPTNLKSKEQFIESIINLIESLQNQLTITAVGIGFPGSVNTITGEIYSAVNLGFDSLDLVNEVTSKFNYSCYILNDANAAAYAEYASNPEISDLIFITLGTGCGGGIVLNNKLHLGSNFVAGEIGHIPTLNGEGRICGCGNIDCLETYVSKLGIIKTAQKSEVIMSHFEDNQFDVVDIVNLHHQNEFEATRLLKDTFTLFGKTIAGLVNTLDVNHIVLGGGISNAGNVILDFIINPLNEHLFPTLKDKVNVTLSTLKNDAGALGAAHYAKDRVISK